MSKADLEIAYPGEPISLSLPKEETCVAYSCGYGGCSALTPARLMKANKDLLTLRAPLRAGVGRDSMADRAEWLSKIMKEVTIPAPDRMVYGKKKRPLFERLFGINEEVIETNRPHLFEMIGGLIPGRVTPYGHRPDVMASDFQIWRETVEIDAKRIAENLRRHNAPLGSLGLIGRSCGSHEIANAYSQYLLEQEIEPNYTVSILPVDSNDRRELLEYLTLLSKWDISKKEVVLFHRVNQNLGLVKSDVALLVSILHSLTITKPDVITLLERARLNSPFIGISLKVGFIPVRTLKQIEKFLWIIPLFSKENSNEDKENAETVIKTLVTQNYSEISKIPQAKIVGIFVHGPFNKSESEYFEEKNWLKGDVPVFFSYGGTFRNNNFAEVYSVGLYTFDPEMLPPYVAEVVGTNSISNAKASYAYMRKGYETLSKLSGIDSVELFRREK